MQKNCTSVQGGIMIKPNIGIYVIKETDTNNIIYVGSTKNFRQRRDGHRVDFKKACQAVSNGHLYNYMAEKANHDKSKFSELFTFELVRFMPRSTEMQRLAQESILYNKLLDKEPLQNIYDPLRNIEVVAMTYPQLKYIGTFISIEETARQLDIPTRGIHRVLAGLWISTKGENQSYTFCRKDEYTADWKPRSKNWNNKKIPVRGINQETGEVLSFQSQKEASIYVSDLLNKKWKTVYIEIMRCLNGFSKSAYGFTWEAVERGE